MFDYHEMTLGECQSAYVTTDRPIICDADTTCAFFGEVEEDNQKCKHEWEYYYPKGEEHRRCAKCGVITE